MISVQNINEDKQFEKFCAELKPQVRLEVLESGSENLDQAARIALNLNSTICEIGQCSGGIASGCNELGPYCMDLGNVEGQPHYHGGSIKGNKKAREQSLKNITNNACFKCNKRG